MAGHVKVDCSTGAVEIIAETAQQIADREAAEAASVPEKVTALQLRRAARGSGQYAAFLNHVTTDGADLLDWWQTKTTIRRDDPTLAAIAVSLGVGNGALNTLFRNAAAIAV